MKLVVGIKRAALYNKAAGETEGKLQAVANGSPVIGLTGKRVNQLLATMGITVDKSVSGMLIPLPYLSKVTISGEIQKVAKGDLYSYTDEEIADFASRNIEVKGHIVDKKGNDSIEVVKAGVQYTAQNDTFRIQDITKIEIEDLGAPAMAYLPNAKYSKADAAETSSVTTLLEAVDF